MENGKKAAIGATVLALLVVGARVGMIYRERHAPAAQTAKADAGHEKLPDDAYVFLKKKRPSSMSDLKELLGTTVWMSAGGQMDFYAVTGKHVDYAKKEGTILGAQPLLIKDAVEQVAPKFATFRVPGGEKQVLLLFTIPPSAQGPGSGDKVYGLPVGYREGSTYTFYTDELFFYEDPHVLYKHWGPEVWKAVDEHRAILGMSEAQVQMALGQVSDSVSQEYGDRRVMFANLGHPMDVIFVKNKATAIMPHQ
jgi:hypothetical protein